VRHAFKALPEFVRVKARIGIGQYRWNNSDSDASEIQRIEPGMVSNDQRTYFAGLDSILEQIGGTDFRRLNQFGEGPADRITLGEPMNDRILGRIPFGIPEPSTPHGRAIVSLNVGHSVCEAVERRRSS
jgi:hypothetical protein